MHLAYRVNRAVGVISIPGFLLQLGAFADRLDRRKDRTAVVTMRGEAIRIISVRRSWDEEVRRYEFQDD